ncbi:MAG: hypothetical protein M3R53_05025 [Candidatus Eremiobacteraeota bacterium]|nr:hypothetical protein [Candidatus Eremiobacteraeota bacterium]
MQFSAFIASLGALVVFTTSVGLTEPAHGAVVGLHARKIAIGEQNGSGQTGHASLKQVGNDMQVTLDLDHASKMAEPAHIHKGTCAKLDPVPAFPLKPVTNGKSVTTVHGFTFGMVKKGHYAINVHKSAAALKSYVACGDL